MNARVLVVEDSPTLSYSMETLLTRNGFDVRCAADGLSALSAIADYRPHVMLLDIYLPQVDGIQVCQALRKDSKYDEMPIVVISGANREHIDEALAAGADAFLMKPVADQEVVESVYFHLERVVH
jgi:DNA-binding response OmpR family regulator